MDPSALLRAGAELLAPVLTPAGFAVGPVEAGVGSGGPFAVGRFTRGDGRALELHVRGALGIVVYRAPGVAVEHAPLMRAAAGDERPAYPGFSADPLDGFRHLRADLERFGAAFLAGSDVEFAAQAARGQALAQERRGFRALA